MQVYENLYSELPMQAVMLEDVAPSTSIGNGQQGPFIICPPLMVPLMPLGWVQGASDVAESQGW